jgi:DNA-binding CsgD family transcriptional regulator
MIATAQIDSPIASSSAMAVGDPAYFREIGQVARAIGAEHFHEKLLSLFEAVIEHDSAWLVRYSRNAPPDVITTRGVAKHLVDIYLEHAYYSSDPFFCDWCSNDRSGVMLLRDAFDAAGDKDFYRLTFRRKARFSDEMGMILPTLGQSCIAFFIERANGHFTDQDEAIARSVFPAIEGLHRAHLANLFAALRGSGTPVSRKMLTSPTLIVDRTGASIHANAEWRKWERSDPIVKSARVKLESGNATTVVLTETATMRMERFNRGFQLAPSGRIFVITESLNGADASAALSRAHADLQRLSRRERQLVSLIVLGWTLGEIATRLGIGKGTIKNYRLSLYRKLSISSERTLISRFWPLIEEFRKNPTGDWSAVVAKSTTPRKK